VYRYLLYGLVVESPRQLYAPSVTGTPDIVIAEHFNRRPAATPPNKFGYSYNTLADGSIHVSWSELFDFLVSADGTRIDLHVGAQGDPEPAYIYLISQVISVALLQRGIESLHAGAVAIDGKALVLLGESGCGKSTLTAALVQRGAKLITDDLLVLQHDENNYEAVPGAFRIKLEPDTATRLGIDWLGTPMADGSGKHVYRLADAQCVTGKTPLAQLVVLEPTTGPLQAEPLPPAQATRTLLEATFNPLHTEPPRLASLLANSSRLVAELPVSRLYVPRDLRAIRAVAQAVETQLYTARLADNSRLSR
jgi:hypothetical protein